MNHKTSIIVISWNGEQFLSDCINSIVDQTIQPLEILIIDNGSSDGSIECIAPFYHSVKIILNRKNLGVAAAWNIGVRTAKGEILGFVNQDVKLNKDWLEQIENAIIKYSNKAIIGSKLLYPDGRTIQHAGGEICYPTAFTTHRGKGLVDNGDFDDPIDVDYVTGAAFAIPRELFETLGGFDEGFYPAYYEETDLCVRAHELGYRVVYYPKALAVHYESTSLGSESTAFFRTYNLNRLRFVFKHLDARELLECFLDQEFERITEGTMNPSEIDALKWVYRCHDGALLEAASSRWAVKRVLKTLQNKCETL